MTRPFDLIDGKKIDLNNQSHRNIVIQRNKTLQKALEEGICILDKIVNIKVITRVTIDCLVCGSTIDEDNVEDFKDVMNEYPSRLPTIKCSCCKTSYHYHKNDDTYNLSIPKPKK